MRQELKERTAIVPSVAPGKKWKLVALRVLLVVLGLAAWFGTQAAIGSRHAATGTLPIESDGILRALTPVHDYLTQHFAARNALLISSSAVIDLLTLLLLFRAIFGNTIRPFLGLLIVF